MVIWEEEAYLCIYGLGQRFQGRPCDLELLQAINDNVLQVKDEFRKEPAIHM